EDALDAVAWIRQRAAALHADTNNFVLLGRSAGAQIALVAAYSSHDPAIRGVVSFYGPADMVWGYSLPANPWVMDSRKVMVDYLGGTYDEVPNLYAQSSATESVHPAAPPTLMIHGQNDVLVAYEHNSRLIRKLDSLQRPNFLLTLPWATHGCDYTLNGPSGQLITYTLERYLKWVLKG
ncbi:MAG: alpha/beta hydrolase, partial [Sphingobacteriales bacterium]